MSIIFSVFYVLFTARHLTPTRKQSACHAHTTCTVLGTDPSHVTTATRCRIAFLILCPTPLSRSTVAHSLSLCPASMLPCSQRYALVWFTHIILLLYLHYYFCVHLLGTRLRRDAQWRFSLFFSAFSLEKVPPPGTTPAK